MIPSISHDREEETPEAKVRWFRSLSVEERMDYFSSLYELALENNPDIVNQKAAEPIPGRVQVLALP
jgi:hypothetical protein